MTRRDLPLEGGALRFVFDYVDPGSYLAAAILDRVARSRVPSLPVEWVPLELRPPPASRPDPGTPEWAGLIDAAGEAAARAGIPFRAPPFIPWSRKAHELALLAAEKGCFERVHQTLFEALFVRGMDIGRVDVLAGLGGECGLDPAEVRTVLGVDRFGPRMDEIRAALLREGIRGVPLLQANGKQLAGFKDAAEVTAFLNTL